MVFLLLTCHLPPHSPWHSTNFQVSDFSIFQRREGRENEEATRGLGVCKGAVLALQAPCIQCSTWLDMIFPKRDTTGLWSEIILGCTGLPFIEGHLASLALGPRCRAHFLPYC